MRSIVRSRIESVSLLVLLLALVAPSAVGATPASPGPPRCNSHNTPHKQGCLDVLTEGGNVGMLQWVDPDTILFQSYNDLDRAVVSTRTITTLDGPGASLGFRAFSPDRSKLVYTTFQPDASVRTMPAGGGTPFEVTSAPANTAALQGPVWRADGQRIAYVNDFVGGEIDWVPASGGSPTVVMAAGNYFRGVLAYSADGTMIVGQSDRSGQNGALLRVTESGVQTLLVTGIFGAVASPDGSVIAYETSAGDVYAVPAPGGAPISLGVSVDPFSAIAFSPDGSLLAVGGFDPTRTRVAAYVAHVDGSGAIELPFPGFEFGWSPDGSRIAVYGGDPSTDTFSLAVVNADGTHLRQLYQGICSSPVFSTDGSKIACILFVPDPSGGFFGSNELGVLSVR